MGLLFIRFINVNFPKFVHFISLYLQNISLCNDSLHFCSITVLILKKINITLYLIKEMDLSDMKDNSYWCHFLSTLSMLKLRAFKITHKTDV